MIACHPGLPRAGCTILAATSSQLAAIRSKAVATAGLFVADMPSAAQSTRVYDEYLEKVSQAGAAPVNADRAARRG